MSGDASWIMIALKSAVFGSLRMSAGMSSDRAIGSTSSRTSRGAASGAVERSPDRVLERHVQAQALSSLHQHVERLRDARLGRVLALDDRLVDLRSGRSRRRT